MTKEGVLANGLSHVLWQYNKFISTVPPENWAQLEKANAGFIGYKDATDVFSFIAMADRQRFPQGNLILVQSKAMPWPAAWKTWDPTKLDFYLTHKSHKPIRYLVYEENGEYLADYWYETKFQEMLAETGIVVPPPIPYTPQLFKQAAQAVPNVSTSGTAPTSSQTTLQPSAIPAPTSTSVLMQPIKQPANPVWWIFGLIILVTGAVFIVRKKTPRV